MEGGTARYRELIADTEDPPDADEQDELDLITRSRALMRRMEALARYDELIHRVHPCISSTHLVFFPEGTQFQRMLRGAACTRFTHNIADAYLRGCAQTQQQVKGRCFWCDKPAKSRCSRCSCYHYCSKACQLAHWKRGGHKKRCGQRHINQMGRGRGFELPQRGEELLPFWLLRDGPSAEAAFKWMGCSADGGVLLLRDPTHLEAAPRTAEQPLPTRQRATADEIIDKYFSGAWCATDAADALSATAPPALWGLHDDELQSIVSLLSFADSIALSQSCKQLEPLLAQELDRALHVAKPVLGSWWQGGAAAQSDEATAEALRGKLRVRMRVLGVVFKSPRIACAELLFNAGFRDGVTTPLTTREERNAAWRRHIYGTTKLDPYRSGGPHYDEMTAWRQLGENEAGGHRQPYGYAVARSNHYDTIVSVSETLASRFIVRGGRGASGNSDSRGNLPLHVLVGDDGAPRCRFEEDFAFGGEQRIDEAMYRLFHRERGNSGAAARDALAVLARFGKVYSETNRVPSGRAIMMHSISRNPDFISGAAGLHEAPAPRELPPSFWPMGERKRPWDSGDDEPEGLPGPDRLFMELFESRYTLEMLGFDGAAADAESDAAEAAAVAAVVARDPDMPWPADCNAGSDDDDLDGEYGGLPGWGPHGSGYAPPSQVEAGQYPCLCQCRDCVGVTEWREGPPPFETDAWQSLCARARSAYERVGGDRLEHDVVMSSEGRTFARADADDIWRPIRDTMRQMARTEHDPGYKGYKGSKASDETAES